MYTEYFIVRLKRLVTPIATTFGGSIGDDASTDGLGSMSRWQLAEECLQ